MTVYNQAVSITVGATTWKLPEHNRSPLKFSYESLKNESRTIDGTLRTYAIGMKTSIDLSWSMLPAGAGVGDVIGPVDYVSGVASADLMRHLYYNYCNSYVTITVAPGSGTGTGTNVPTIYTMKFTGFTYEVVKRLTNVTYVNVSMSLAEV